MTAQAEELSESGVDKPAEKRKRSPADVDGGSQDTTSHGEGLVSKQRNKRQAMSTETVRGKKDIVTFSQSTLTDLHWEGFKEEGVILQCFCRPVRN